MAAGRNLHWCGSDFVKFSEIYGFVPHPMGGLPDFYLWNIIYVELLREKTRCKAAGLLIVDIGSLVD